MSDKPYLQFHQTLPGLSDKVHSQFHQTLPKLSDKPRLQFHQTLPELSDKPHLIFFQTLPELSDKPHLPFFQTPHELSDKAHLIFFQTLPESRNVQNSFEFYPPPPLRIQPKNNLHSEEENLLPYHDEIILRTGMPSPNTSSRNILCFHFLFAVVLHRLSVFFECPGPLLSYTVILPPFRSFFTFLSPFPDSLFTCLRHRIPLSVFMLSCCRKVSKNVSENIKTYIYKNKFISLFSYLSTQIFFYYNLHLLI